MKKAFSDLAWDTSAEEPILRHLRDKGFTGLEIAPTKLFGPDPYDHAEEAKDYARRVYECYGLRICSMQSIWYGQQGNIFCPEDRRRLRDYTMRAIDFAAAIGCGNLVFGNPKARKRIADDQDEAVKAFFTAIGTYAGQQGTCVSLEPNPPIYGTDFINTTQQALDYLQALDAPMKLNADLGAMLYNKEDMSLLHGHIHRIGHVHISEPYLALITQRPIHRALSALGYDGYVSAEMGFAEDPAQVLRVIDYLSEVLAQ